MSYFRAAVGILKYGFGILLLFGRATTLGDLWRLFVENIFRLDVAK